MFTISPQAWVVQDGEAGQSHITDLVLRQTESGTVLYATTRYDGGICALSADTLCLIDSCDYPEEDTAGARATLTYLDVGPFGALLCGGGTAGAAQMIYLSANGDFDKSVTLTGLSADFSSSATYDPDNVTLIAYGGLASGAGIARFRFSDAGRLTANGVTADYTDTYAGGVSALTVATVAGTTYTLSTATEGDGVTVWSTMTNGFLKSVGSMGAENGLWVSDPTAMITAEVDGRTFVVLASAGSGSLSVMELSATGALTVTDHVIDDLNTRFSGVTALASCTRDGQTWIVAGGADDGISLFYLGSDGRLILMGTVADSTQTGLSDISALEITATATGLDIFAASSSEYGVTQLSVDLGTGLNIVTGTNGANTLNGTARADLIIDGAGGDWLTGGAGQDCFVLVADGQADVITDFQLGVDQIDLSRWSMLRSLSQLTITQTATGFTVAYADEFLTVNAAAGTNIPAANLTFSDLIGLTHLPIVAQPTPSPAVEFVGTRKPDAIIANDLDNIIRGMAGNDSLCGGAGADRINGGPGDDVLDGEAGADRLFGKVGADLLYGRDGNDRLKGGGGTDILWGGSGNDRLKGGAGDDLLYGENGTDRLQGGGGNDTLIGVNGADRLSGGAGDDQIDILGNDIASGGKGADTFVFYGGDATITDYQPHKDFLALDDTLFEAGETLRSILRDHTHITDEGVVIDMADGSSLVLSGISTVDGLAAHLSLF